MLKIDLQTYSRTNADLAEILEAFAADLRPLPWGQLPALTDEDGKAAGRVYWTKKGPNGQEDGSP